MTTFAQGRQKSVQDPLDYNHEQKAMTLKSEQMPTQERISAPDIGKYLEIFKERGSLFTREATKFIRETQNELTSAWKFYIGMGADKQALILADGFTTLPLSLARNCAHVVVYGLNEAETRLLQDLAIAKKISNYSCVDQLHNLATQFDIIILIIAERNHEERKRLIFDIRKYIHASTEIWLIAINEYSLWNLRSLAEWARSRVPGGRKNVSEQLEIRLPLNQRPVIKSRKVNDYFKLVGCRPFVSVGLKPTLLRLRLARPLRDERMPSLNGAALKGMDRFRVGEIAIGATPAKLTPSFLDRLLKSLQLTPDHSVSIHNYLVSTSGKALIFLSYGESSERQHAILKLPLNEFADYRLKLNQNALKRLQQASMNCGKTELFFPEPLREGMFEGQPYYVENILSGQSGDRISFSKGEKDRVVYELFAFWSGQQRHMARAYYLDDKAFDTLINRPLNRVFLFFDPNGKQVAIRERLRSFLREKLLNRRMYMTLVHGDFSLKNIIFHESFLTFKGIVDWDMSQPLSFPILDLFHFFVRDSRYSYRKSPVALLTQILEQPEKVGNFRSILEMYMDTFDIRHDDLSVYVILYWIQRISAHMGTLKILDKRFMKRNFDSSLKLFEKQLESF
ncbi:MAG: phosphotransferase [candidate division KSB1 bacterium]|nr:phosphotransferase [candidate division KSB1 bacterium]